MKRMFIIAGAIVLLLLACTKKPDQTELDVVVTKQPIGGSDVTYLECVILGTLHDEDDITPITATIQWMVSESQTDSGISVWSDTCTFTSETPKSVTVFMQAPEGCWMCDYWYVLVEWINEDGTDCECESNRAYCY